MTPGLDIRFIAHWDNRVLSRSRWASKGTKSSLVRVVLKDICWRPTRQTYMHGKKNYANRHHEQLIIAITICNKAILVPDLVKIWKTGAETDINLLYKHVQNYMPKNSNMT